MTFEQLSGITERGWGHAASLWSVKTGQSRPLPGRLFYWSVYTPDSRRLAAPADLGSGQSAIKLFDTATGREIGSIAVPEKNARIAYLAYSPDGKLLVGQVRDEAKSQQHWLRFWDPATGRTLASIEGEKGAFFMHMAFSPDGRSLLATDSVNEGRLALFDVRGKKLVRTLVLEKKAYVSGTAFSPDGKWLVALTQVIPGRFSGATGSRKTCRSRIFISSTQRAGPCARHSSHHKGRVAQRVSAPMAGCSPRVAAAGCCSGI